MDSFLLGSKRSSGRLLLLKLILACLRDKGKNITSDLDWMLSDPRYMMSTNLAKCLSRSIMAWRSSWQVWKTKKLLLP